VSQPRILVVEDNEALLTILQDILLQEGYAVDAVSGAALALKVMEGVRPDLIVSDIVMPNMDGYAFCERVRARPEWAAIPFIFVSAKTDKDDVLKAKELGAEDYIVKPFGRDELVLAVRARIKRAQAIRQSMDAEFERLRQEITRVLSHELRTPLSILLLHTEPGLEQIGSLGPERLSELLTGIRQGAQRLNRLSEDLLLLVALDTGQAAQEHARDAKVRDDLGSIIENTVAHYQPQAAAQAVTVQVKIANDLSVVRLHESGFTDALARLLHNAIKFSSMPGQRVTVSAQSVEGGVEVAVADQGIGITPEELPHIFERFRETNHNGVEQQGCGVGLAIARGLIGLHGGQIRVESAPGQGSVFTIRLPSVAGARSEQYQRAGRDVSRASEAIVAAYAATLLEASPTLARERDAAQRTLHRADIGHVVECLAQSLTIADPTVFTQCVIGMEPSLTLALGSPLAAALAWMLLKQAIADQISPRYRKLALGYFDRGKGGVRLAVKV
jgi:two-component system, sensor histidine kinase and response regulator